MKGVFHIVIGSSSLSAGLGHEIILDFSAYKEKLMKEELVLHDANDNSRSIKLVLYARVLGEVQLYSFLPSSVAFIAESAPDVNLIASQFPVFLMKLTVSWAVCLINWVGFMGLRY